VDDEFAGQVVAPGQLGFAGGAAAQRAAFLQQLRPGGPVDRAIHPATSKQAVVCGVDYGIHPHSGDIVFDNLKRHKNPPVRKSEYECLLPVLYHIPVPFAKWRNDLICNRTARVDLTCAAFSYFGEIPHYFGGWLAREYFVSCACRFRRLTGSKSRNLQDANGGKGIARRAARIVRHFP
jgi:hypothetical protein